MIDYFALLNQPRRPWLDLDDLKNTYHRNTLQTHPDVQNTDKSGAETKPDFATFNEAYQVLRDPKRRLQHLLTLEEVPPAPNSAIPQQLGDLFPVIGGLTHRSKILLAKVVGTSSGLSRSLLQADLLALQKEATMVREKIQDLLEAAHAELHRISQTWEEDQPGNINALSNLYPTFAYLSRWLAQLDELIFQFDSVGR